MAPSQEDADGGKLDEGKEVGAELGVAGGDVPEVRQLIEEALVEVAFAVDRLLPSVLSLAISTVWDFGDGALGETDKDDCPTCKSR